MIDLRGRPMPTQTPSFAYRASSANIDFYQASAPSWGHVQVRVDSLVKAPDGKVTVRKPALFYVRVYEHKPVEVTPVETRFTYAPKTPVKGNRLSDRTVTRLVRAHLNGDPK